jgi:hypothetical protein
MVIDTHRAPNDTLAAILVARARAASDGRLVLDVIAGVIGATGIAVWQPPVWAVPFGVALCLAMFGVWGIADREITERVGASQHRFVRLLRIVQLLTILGETVAAMIASLALLGVALGTWIS